jgi:transposase
MDVSLKETSICVVDGSGGIVSEGTVISEPAAIAAFIEARAASALRIGLETGPTTTWLWHELRALGLPVICIDARHAKAALSLQINKSDRNDAVGLARIMQCGWYKEVQVKSVSCHELRAVLNSRAQLVKIKRDLENQIRGLLKNLGLVIGKAGGTVFTRRVEDLLGRQGLLWEAVRPLLAVREIVRREIAGRYRRLLGLARNDVDSRRSMTVPGIGPITALAFYAAVDDPARFRRSAPRGRLFRADAAPHCLGRGRLDRADLQMRRSNAQDLPVRGRWRAAHPGATVVHAQSLGSQAVETHRLQEGQGRRGTEAGGHPPSHVA